MLQDILPILVFSIACLIVTGFVPQRSFARLTARCPVAMAHKCPASSTPSPYLEIEGSGSPCRIKVIGVGGGGGNAVNRIIQSANGIPGVELWTVNTDAQALSKSLAANKLNIGSMISRYCPLYDESNA